MRSLSPPSVWVFVHQMCITFSAAVPSSGCLAALLHGGTNITWCFLGLGCSCWVVICWAISFDLSFKCCTCYKLQNSERTYFNSSSPSFFVFSKHPHAYASCGFTLQPSVKKKKWQKKVICWNKFNKHLIHWHSGEPEDKICMSLLVRKPKNSSRQTHQNSCFRWLHIASKKCSNKTRLLHFKQYAYIFLEILKINSETVH